MTKTFSIIMPAFKAEPTIAHAVKSVLVQTYPHWSLVVISDDGADYASFLAGTGIADPRLIFLSSGQVKAGASRARNVGLDVIDTPYAAVLDADDAYKPEKLERVAAALEEHAVVSTALDVMSDAFVHHRFVGDGKDRFLAAGEHKWVNLSMDTMVAWDRSKADARYDPGLPNLTDLDFLLKLYRTAPGSFHIGTPLHDYVKLAVSMSNGPGVTERMIGVKTLLLERLADGFYPMADTAARDGMERFLRISLGAEKSYPEALAAQPGLLFENHLEPLLGIAFA